MGGALFGPYFPIGKNTFGDEYQNRTSTDRETTPHKNLPPPPKKKKKMCVPPDVNYENFSRGEMATVEKIQALPKIHGSSSREICNFPRDHDIPS